jgi:hypothetical protein
MASVKSHTSPRGIAQQRFASDVEVAKIFGLSPKTLQKWRLFHVGPPFYKVGNRAVRYNLEEVEQYVRTGAGGTV